MPFVLSPDEYARHQARVASQRSQMRADDNIARAQRSGPPVSPPTSPSAVLLGPAVPAAPLLPGADPARPTPRGAGLLVLPWPPTGNHAVKHANGAHYLTPEVARYRRHVAALCYGARMVTGRYALHVHLSPPDARARDMDNAIKSIGDALVRAGWLPDDSMAYMRELHVTVDDARNASATVRVVPLDDPKEAA